MPLLFFTLLNLKGGGGPTAGCGSLDLLQYAAASACFMSMAVLCVEGALGCSKTAAVPVFIAVMAVFRVATVFSTATVAATTAKVGGMAVCGCYNPNWTTSSIPFDLKFVSHQYKKQV
jgi:hypothetical protein